MSGHVVMMKLPITSCPELHLLNHENGFHGGIFKLHAKSDADSLLYSRDVKLIFTGGHISLVVDFKGLNVILGLYTCNYSLTRGKELGAAT